MSELEEIAAELEEQLDRCRKGLLRSGELQELLLHASMRAQFAVPKDSDAHRMLDKGFRESTVWTQQTVSGYASPRDCEQIARRRDLILSVLNELEPEFLRDANHRKRQYYFEAGERYRAMRVVYSILGSAASNADIVDEYLDADVFDYVRSLSQEISWRLLTGLRKPIFPRLLAETVNDGFQVEARENTACHDRFIVIDGDAAVWHLGASLNGLGKKACMLNLVSDTDERAALLTDFTRWWESASAVE